MNDSIMPLVALLNENAVLRHQLAEQSARIDMMLQESPVARFSLKYVSVSIEHRELLLGRDKLPGLLAQRLAEALVAEAPSIAQRVEGAYKDLLHYRFAFVSLGGVK